jgi:hypothetical protein
MRKYSLIIVLLLFLSVPHLVHAQAKPTLPPPAASSTDKEALDATMSAQADPSPTPTPSPRPDFTQTSEQTVVGPLEQLLKDQKLGPVWPFNPVKYAIRGAVKAGVPPNTIILLLLLPLIAAFIAAARHIVGLRGFGIFLPASLAVVFLAIGPLIGIGLFGLIVIVSTVFRIFLRKIRVRLQYLPRMSLILQLVILSVLGVLFLAPIIPVSDITNVSIFPVLILALLAEDFSKIQIGKSARTAITLGTETIIMSLISYLFLTTPQIQQFALLKPEIMIISVMIFNLLLGKYIGLRLIEYWKYRKLILGK